MWTKNLRWTQLLVDDTLINNFYGFGHALILLYSVLLKTIHHKISAELHCILSWISVDYFFKDLLHLWLPCRPSSHSPWHRWSLGAKFRWLFGNAKLVRSSNLPLVHYFLWQHIWTLHEYRSDGWSNSCGEIELHFRIMGKIGAMISCGFKNWDLENALFIYFI